VFLAGIIGLICGAAVLLRDEGDWRPGRGTLPALLLALGSLGLWLLGPAMWRAHEPRDPRFWQFFGNTVYLMLGIPFSIAGSLALALLLNDDLLPPSARRTRLVGSLLCAVCGRSRLRSCGGWAARTWRCWRPFYGPWPRSGSPST
jgi:hypothetical protein